MRDRLGIVWDRRALHRDLALPELLEDRLYWRECSRSVLSAPSGGAEGRVLRGAPRSTVGKAVRLIRSSGNGPKCTGRLR